MFSLTSQCSTPTVTFLRIAKLLDLQRSEVTSQAAVHEAAPYERQQTQISHNTSVSWSGPVQGFEVFLFVVRRKLCPVFLSVHAFSAGRTGGSSFHTHIHVSLLWVDVQHWWLTLMLY